MRKRVRLIPCVTALSAVLLLIKSWGVAVEARAQDTASAPIPHPAASSTAKPAADPAADDAQLASPSAVDVLTSLSKRRAELDARERDLAMRDNLIAAAAKRVDQRIAELKALQASMQALLGQRDAAEQKQFDTIVKSYSSMKPADAARIFNSLAEDVLVPVAGAMKADVLGAILAKMQPDEAQRLTVKLANRLKPKPDPAPVQQLAAVLPASAPAAQPQASAQPLSPAASSPPPAFPIASAPTPSTATTPPPQIAASTAKPAAAAK